jgi:DNA replication protein DnaC
MENIASHIQAIQERITETAPFRVGTDRGRAKKPRLEGLPERFRRSTVAKYKVQDEFQQQVLESCKEFIQTWMRHAGLILVGPPGTGKTMLGCAILNAIAEQGELTLRYVTQIQAIRLIKSTWGKQVDLDEDQAMKKLITPAVLAIDEVGVPGSTDFDRGILSDICNERYNRRKPTILISNLTPFQLTLYLGEPVIDRFRQGGHVVALDWESCRTKVPEGASQIRTVR